MNRHWRTTYLCCSLLTWACDGPTVYLDDMDADLADPASPPIFPQQGGQGEEEEEEEDSTGEQVGDGRMGAVDGGSPGPLDGGEVDNGECEDCCDADGDCADEGRPFCDPEMSLCVECLLASDCDGQELCTAAGECEDGCTSSAECTGEDGVCDTSQGFCVDCLADTDCAGVEEPACNLVTHECERS